MCSQVVLQLRRRRLFRMRCRVRIRFVTARAMFKRPWACWVAVKELNLSYHNPETIIFGIDPYYQPSLRPVCDTFAVCSAGRRNPSGQRAPFPLGRPRPNLYLDLCEDADSSSHHSKRIVIYNHHSNKIIVTVIVIVINYPDTTTNLFMFRPAGFLRLRARGSDVASCKSPTCSRISARLTQPSKSEGP